MCKHLTNAVVLVLLFTFFPSGPAFAQGQQGLTEEQLKTAASEVPRLVDLLQLKPGMALADVGAGFGAWSMAFAKVLGPSGRVYATDVGEQQLATIRESAKSQGLTNVTVLEGAERSTNLPAACCNAILIRDAYHHLTQPNDILRSMVAALKPGGHLAVIDFPPRPNSEAPQGVPANRTGHGVPPDVVISEVTAAGLTSISVDKAWGTGNAQSPLFLLIFRKAAN
jgi:precorrin-6B methylase 2